MLYVNGPRRLFPHPMHDPQCRMSVSFVLSLPPLQAYLHSGEQPILHRDLKSGNLLVDDALSVRIADFGLARVKATAATMTSMAGTLGE